ICGGRMRILAEPVVRNQGSGIRDQGLGLGAASYYRRLRELVDQGRGCTEAVVIADKLTRLALGRRVLFDPDGRLAAQTSAAQSPEEVMQHLVPVRQRPRPSVHGGIAYLPILPRITLLIVGGGHVGLAVAKLAAEVDFDIWVLDDRESYASR